MKLSTLTLNYNRANSIISGNIGQIIKESLVLEGADLVDALTEHFPNLPKILAKLGIDVPNLQMVGRGDKGTAFYDGNKIVKITEDEREARASANIMGVDVPGVNKVYHVSRFAKEIPYQEEGDEEPIDTQYYLIIQDYLNTKISRAQSKASELVDEFLIDHLRKIPWPFDPRALLRPVHNYWFRKKHESAMSPEVDKYILELLQSISDLYARHHIKFFDVKGNVGVDADGHLKLFDLGISDSPEVNIPVI